MEFFVISNDIPVFVSDTKGDKPAMVLLHGYLETLSVWDDFAKLIEKDFRVIRIDLPGHGLSGTQPDINTVDFSAAVLFDVLQKCEVKNCIVCGHSMGGYVAQAFAANYPENTRGLVLFHSTPNADTEQKKEDRDREIALIRSDKLSLVVSQSIPHVFAEENVKRFSAKIEELKEVAEMHEPEGIIACLEGMKQRPDRNEFLTKFQKPLVFIFGEKDYYISTEKAQEIAAKFPQAQTLWLKKSGHIGFVEEPETVVSSESWQSLINA